MAKASLIILALILLSAGLVETATYGTYTYSVDLGSSVKLGYKLENKMAVFMVEKSTAGHLVFGIGSDMSSADFVTITKSGDIITSTIVP